METPFEVNIDFDEASREWRKNKDHIGKGYFVYRCIYVHSDGKVCNKQVSPLPQRNICKEWIKKSNKTLDYCKKHLIRGPQYMRV